MLETEILLVQSATYRTRIAQAGPIHEMSRGAALTRAKCVIEQIQEWQRYGVTATDVMRSMRGDWPVCATWREVFDTIAHNYPKPVPIAAETEGSKPSTPIAWCALVARSRMLLHQTAELLARAAELRADNANLMVTAVLSMAKAQALVSKRDWLEMN
jgi:hypothetical protein